MNRVEREALLRRLRRDAERIAAHFGFEYLAIEAERRGVKSRYGACTSDGLITVRLQHAKTGEPLRYSSLIDTLCHELAHLRHFDHGPEFKRLYLKILRWARREGIYLPRPRRGAEPAVVHPRSLGPARKNGVPVFAAPPDPAKRPPWIRTLLDAVPAARDAEPAASDAAAVMAPRAPAVPRVTEAPRATPRMDERLPLFAGVPLERPPRRAARAGRSRAKAQPDRAPTAPDRQLSLF